MFVRKKRNKSGSISVQIVDKSTGKYRVIKSLGSSDDTVQVDRLWREAHRQLPMLIGQSSLPLMSDRDQLISDFMHRGDTLKIRVIGPEQILGKIFDQIGFNQIPDILFRHLVITRLVYPGSKLKTIDYLHRYQGTDLSKDKIYRFLDDLNYVHKSQVEDISFAHTKKVLRGELGIVFYDMTTLYFEAEDEDDLRKTGFSKDGKHQHPQVYLGLLVGPKGWPIGYELFEGDIYEGHTLIPVLKAFESRFNLIKPVVIADAGLLSNQNIVQLTDQGYHYILAARIKNESKKIKEQILALHLADNQYKTIKKDSTNKLVIAYTDKRAKKDRHNRERGLARLEKNLRSGKLTKSHINNRGYNKYLKMEGKMSIKIDYQKFDNDKQWDGLKGYLTNTNLAPNQIIENYNQLWHIEKAFRISKTDLRIRPIYHRLKQRIEAHICLAFTAYTIFKELERELYKNKAPFSAKRAIELLQTIYAIDFQLPESKMTQSSYVSLNDEQKLLLKYFQIQ